MGEWIKITAVSLLLAVLITTFAHSSIQTVSADGYQTRSRVNIDIQGDLGLIELASSKGWKGNGSEDYPFMISDLDVDTVPDSTYIRFSNTSLHVDVVDSLFTEIVFINVTDPLPVIEISNSNNVSIKNCSIFSYHGIPISVKDSGNVSISYVSLELNLSYCGILAESVHNLTISGVDVSSYYPFTGFYIDSMVDSKIENCSFSGLDRGMEFYDLRNCIISENSFENCLLGFGGYQTRGCSYTNNKIDNDLDAQQVDGLWGGMFVGFSFDDLIENNQVKGPVGIVVGYGVGTILKDNQVVSYGDSIWVIDSRNMMITGNLMEGGGFHLTGNMEQDNITGNEVNGKALYYAKNRDRVDEVIGNEYSQVILQNVSNAVIRGLESDHSTIPLDINDCSWIMIDECELLGRTYSMAIGNSDNVSIFRSGFNGSFAGIWLYGQENTTVEDCSIEAAYYGIDLKECSDTRISGNFIRGDQRGIHIDNSFGTTIDRNTIVSPRPIYQDTGGNGIFKMNEMRGGKIYLNKQVLDDWKGEIEKNTQDGRPVYYFIDRDLDLKDLKEDGAFYYFYRTEHKGFFDLHMKGEVIFQDCIGISLSNFTLTGANRGLNFMDCEKIRIGGSNISDISGGYGINIDRCKEVEIRNTKVSNCMNAIRSNDTERFSLSGLDLSFNRYDGASISNDSRYGSITDSIVSSNGRYGIDISSSSVEVLGNEIEFNKGYGIRIRYSSGCEVLQNHFIDNNGAGEVYDEENTQAYDMHSLNMWSKTDTEGPYGNYWSDFDSEDLDADGDGFIDEPYVLQSEEGAFDEFPSVERFDIEKDGEKEETPLWIFTLMILGLLIIVGILSYLMYIGYYRKNEKGPLMPKNKI